MKGRIRRALGTTLTASLVMLAGCTGMGGLESVLGGMGGLGGLGWPGSQLRGEVRRVDHRDQRIDLQTYNGRRERVRYHSRTDVIYRRQRYSVRSLEAGDVVAVQVERDSRGRLYAERIFVEQSVRERRDGRDGRGRVQRFEGRVEWVDRRGQFGLRSSGRSFRVSLPYDPDRSTWNRFRRLRQGSYVRFDGRLVNRGRVELYRFR